MLVGSSDGKAELGGGVGTREDSLNDSRLGCNPGSVARCCMANSAASLSEMAELFFLTEDLKLNFDLGMRAALVSSSFS